MCAVGRASVCDRVARVKSSKRSRSTTVRPTRPAVRIRRVTRSTSADEHGVELVGRARPTGRARAANRSSAGAGRPGPAAGRGCARARAGGGPTPGPSIDTSAASAEPGHLADRDDAALVQLRGGHRPDAPQPLDRQRVQEGELAVGRHDEQAVGLGHAAGHLGQELRPRDADGDRQADLLEHLAAQPHGDLGRRARDPAQPADVEERLVDREPLDERRRVVGTPRTRPCWPRSRPTSAGGRRPPAGTGRAPAARPSPCGRRTPWPRSWPRARPRRRRSPAARAAAGRRAARPTRRTRRGRRAGSWPVPTRTYVRIEHRQIWGARSRVQPASQCESPPRGPSPTSARQRGGCRRA